MSDEPTQKGVRYNSAIIFFYELIEEAIKKGFDIDEVTQEIHDCVDTAHDDYIQDHEDR